MHRVSVVSLRNNVADTVNRVAYGGERVILERRGKGVVALVSLDDLAVLEALDDADDIKAARKALKEKGSVPLAEVKARLGMK